MFYVVDYYISIHSLPKEGDQCIIIVEVIFYEFQSTPSPRRETLCYCLRVLLHSISIHSLPKEGDNISKTERKAQPKFQSTPSPRRETLIIGQNSLNIIFQSTPSPRRETQSPRLISRKVKISIHSLPKEGDYHVTQGKKGNSIFQSTPSPRRETSQGGTSCARMEFQSTPSPRRETSAYKGYR